MAASSALVAISIAVILDIYSKGLLGVGSASFVASVVTLVSVMTVGTMTVDHASVGDVSLLFLYVTYNIWCMTRVFVPPEANYFYK